MTNNHMTNNNNTGSAGGGGGKCPDKSDVQTEGDDDEDKCEPK